MPNAKPEDEVKSHCLIRLEQWKSWGVVIDYDDVSNLGRNMNLYTGRWFMHTKEGKRDLIVWFKVQRILWTYLIECKAPDGGTWTPKQQEYAKKFEGLDNCIYEVVSRFEQIDHTLDRISRRTELLLLDGSIHMGLVRVEEEI
jgi:hypothetical protein